MSDSKQNLGDPDIISGIHGLNSRNLDIRQDGRERDGMIKRMSWREKWEMGEMLLIQPGQKNP